MTTGAADRQISRLGPEIPKTVKHPRRRRQDPHRPCRRRHYRYDRIVEEPCILWVSSAVGGQLCPPISLPGK
jgi:hypothetical protein